MFSITLQRRRRKILLVYVCLMIFTLENGFRSTYFLNLVFTRSAKCLFCLRALFCRIGKVPTFSKIGYINTMGLKIKPPPLRSENLARFRGLLFFSDFDFRKNSRGFLFFSDFDFGKNSCVFFFPEISGKIQICFFQTKNGF